MLRVPTEFLSQMKFLMVGREIVFQPFPPFLSLPLLILQPKRGSKGFRWPSTKPLFLASEHIEVNGSHLAKLTVFEF